MPKYRLLTKEELQSLEKDFVEYLVLNGITSHEWVKLKIDQPTEALRITELFSDVVFEKILRSLRYLDHFSSQSVKCFKCDPERITLIGMDIKDPEYDFSYPEEFARAQERPPQNVEIYSTSKDYHLTRETELFNMIQAGCIISKGNNYHILSGQLPFQ